MKKLEDIGFLVARILMPILFITAGWGKITGYAGTQQYMEAMGVPGFLLPLRISRRSSSLSCHACGASIIPRHFHHLQCHQARLHVKTDAERFLGTLQISLYAEFSCPFPIRWQHAIIRA